MQSTLQLFGKRHCQLTLAEVVTGSDYPLLYVFDRESALKYLVDTGAEISVLPASNRDRYLGNVGPVLLAANNTPIKTYGKRSVKLILGNRRFCWDFTIADVPQPLLGADFLRSNKLLVDLRSKRLIDSETFISVPCDPATCIPHRLATIATATTTMLDYWRHFQQLLHQLSPNLPSNME